MAQASAVSEASLSNLQLALEPTPSVALDRANPETVGREAVACSRLKREFGDDPAAFGDIGDSEIKRFRVTQAAAGGQSLAATAKKVSALEEGQADLKKAVSAVQEGQADLKSASQAGQATLNNKIAELTGIVTALGNNACARSHNSMSSMVNHGLTVLQMEKGGIDGRPPGAVPDVMNGNPSMPGVVGLFPRTIGDISYLSDDQLDALENFYQVQFTGGNLNGRRDRLRAFLGAR